MRLRLWSQGIPGKPAKSGIRGEWIQSLAAVLAQAFLTSVDSHGVSPATFPSGRVGGCETGYTVD
jgi:hypothetical protein